VPRDPDNKLQALLKAKEKEKKKRANLAYEAHHFKGAKPRIVSKTEHER
jgi:hypothetical protein